MREFNTRVAEGNYIITFETDDRKAYEQVQTLCRILIDGKSGDVIPVEWIEDYVADHWKTTKLYATNYVWQMLADWEKENETNRQR